MAKKVYIKVKNTKEVDNLSLIFPQKCVNCGKPEEMSLEFELKKYVVEDGFIPLENLHVPYCIEHGEQLKK